MAQKLREKYEVPIRQVLAKGFEQDLLAAAFDNLCMQGRLSFNNFSYALRELLRHVLHRLAPDNEVKACSWFKPDKNATGGITRGHRATYAIQGGLSDAFVSKKLGIDVHSVRKDLLDAIEVLNKHTHIEPSTFSIKNSESRQLAEECLVAAKYFVDHIFKCRALVVRALSDSIDQHLINQVISETVDSIDELAAHHYIDEIYVEDIRVVEIGPSAIHLEMDGTVGCELQYGSNSDVRNDIGALISASFPLRAVLTVQMMRPLGKSATVEKFVVDTSSWYE